MNRKVAYIDVNEWNRRVMRFIWIGLLNILLVEILLFFMYKPVPECSKLEYFRLFVITPVIPQLIAVVGMELASRFVRILGEQFVTVCMVVGQFVLIGTLVAVHNSVPFMCMTLVYPLILTSVYRRNYIRYLAVGLCIGIYTGIMYGIIPSTEFQPQNSTLTYVIIFISFSFMTIVCTNILTSVVVAFEDQNKKLKEENSKIIEDTRRDSMTNLYNHKAFYEALNERATQQKQFSMVIMDIDNFKRINDTYGHAAGDQAILQVVAIIKKHIGKNDIAARYGGEEFAVLLPGKNESEAYEVAEQIRNTCETHKMSGISEKIRFLLE